MQQVAQKTENNSPEVESGWRTGLVLLLSQVKTRATVNSSGSQKRLGPKTQEVLCWEGRIMEESKGGLRAGHKN